MRMHQKRNFRHNFTTGPTPFWGTLQNPEAHKNSMSRAEADAFAERHLAQLARHRAIERELEQTRALAAAPAPILAPFVASQ